MPPADLSCYEFRGEGGPMPARLDHLILLVNDETASVDFYTHILGFTHEGQRGPFTPVRVAPDLVLQLAPWRTTGGTHLAFAVNRAEFDALFARVRAAGIPYGDAFDSVGSMRGLACYDEDCRQGS